MKKIINYFSILLVLFAPTIVNALCTIPELCLVETASAKLGIECDSNVYLNDTFKCTLKGEFENIGAMSYNVTVEGMEMIKYELKNNWSYYSQNTESHSFALNNPNATGSQDVMVFTLKALSNISRITIDEFDISGTLDTALSDNNPEIVEHDTISKTIYVIPELANLNVIGYTNSPTSYSYTLTPSFNEKTTIYNINLKEDATELKINATASNEDYTFVDGYGPRDVTLNDTTSSYQIKLKNGTQTNTYTINLIRPSSSTDTTATGSNTTTTTNDSSTTSSNSTVGNSSSSETIENPKTGAAINILILILGLSSLIFIFIYVKKKKIIFKV